MVFEKGAPLYASEIERRDGEDIIYINFMQAEFSPSIAEDANVMARAIDVLIETPEASRIVLVQQRNYNYPFEQTAMLLEIAQIYNFLVKSEEILSP